MARYTGPVCKLCSREGMKLFLKSDKCFTTAQLKSYPASRTALPASWPQSIRLWIAAPREAEVPPHLRRLERQFRRHFEAAEKRPGLTGENLFLVLEMRLDNVVYRLGFATPGHRLARSCATATSWSTGIRPISLPIWSSRRRNQRQPASAPSDTSRPCRSPCLPAGRRLASVNATNLSGRFERVPARDELGLDLNEQLIVEYYSR